MFLGLQPNGALVATVDANCDVPRDDGEATRRELAWPNGGAELVDPPQEPQD
jgi:hypothetical protein